MENVTALLEAELTGFATEWFDLLSSHEHVTLLEQFLTDGTDLEMVFPERTMLSLEDFRDWYSTVGRAFVEQSHELESLTVTARGDEIDLAVVVVWRATNAEEMSGFGSHPAH